MPMSIQAFDEFESDLLKAADGSAASATFARDLAGGTTFVLLHHPVGARSGSVRARPWWRDTPDALIDAVEAIARRQRAEIRTGASGDDDRGEVLTPVSGVVLADGGADRHATGDLDNRSDADARWVSIPCGLTLRSCSCCSKHQIPRVHGVRALCARFTPLELHTGSVPTNWPSVVSLLRVTVPQTAPPCRQVRSNVGRSHTSRSVCRHPAGRRSRRMASMCWWRAFSTFPTSRQTARGTTIAGLRSVTRSPELSIARCRDSRARALSRTLTPVDLELGLVPRRRQEIN